MKNPNSNSTAVLFVICLAASLVPFMSSALNLALPFINSDLSIDAVTSGWIPSSYLLSTAIFQIPCARLADMVGRKKIFLLGIIIFFLTSILSGIAYTATSLIIYRFLAGIGSAMVFGTNMAILTASVTPEKRGRALGINSGVVYFSLAAGPFFGGMLTQHFGWHSIFFVAAGVSLLVLMGTILFIKEEWAESDKQKFDFKGAALYAIGLSSLIYGFSQLPHLFGIVLVIAGILVLIGFALYERKESQPVFNTNVFLDNRLFRYSSIAALINYSATTATAFMLSLYLQYVRGLSPQDAGLLLIVQSLVMAVTSLAAGRLSDKVQAGFLATLGMFIVFLGLVCLCFVDGQTSFYYIVAVLVLIGLGFGIFSSPNMNVIMGSVEKKHYGLASATTGTMRLTGQSFSMGIAMMAISTQIGNKPLSAATNEGLVSSMHIAFIIFALLCLIGVYASSVRNGKHTT